MFDKVRNILGLCPGRARDGHHSLLRQIVESLGLLAKTGNGPGFYQMAGFWRREARWGEMLGYLGPRQYKRRVNTLNSLK